MEIGRRKIENVMVIAGNVMVIAGYDVAAHHMPAHREYIAACIKRAAKENITLIVCIGGHTNPDYPGMSEASANAKILDDLGCSIERWVIPIGDTATEALSEARWSLTIALVKIGKLVLCAEQSRLAGFLADALQIGLAEMGNELMAVGYAFPETYGNFGTEKQKMLIGALSHRSRVFAWVRRVLQKRHQKKVARIKKISEMRA